VRLKTRWAAEDKWIYPRKNFENLPRALCEEYDTSVLHAAEAMTASFMQDRPARPASPTKAQYPTKLPGPGQQLERPIFYISRATLPYQTRYEASELEMACLVWAVGRLREYLEGAPFKVFTDHSAIPGILRLSAGTTYSLRVDKFRMQLMPFVDNMEITHQHGKSIPHVDCQSRNVSSATSRPDSVGGVRCPSH
jgi:hypothetical protein